MIKFRNSNLGEKNPAIKSFLLIMKLSFILCFLGMIQVSASVFSQSTKLTFSYTDKSIKEVLQEIEKTTEIRFLYNEDYIDVNRKVTFEGTEMEVDELLSDLFKSSGANFRVLEDNLIVIAPREMMQQNVIKGTVTDKNGEPLAGVNIVATGTTTGTLTDINGKYSIEIPEGVESLTFSFVGMETQEIKTGALTRIDVTMIESAIGLDEVVVIGYGTVKKSDLTGAVSSVGRRQINDQPIARPQDVLQGRMSGVDVVQRDGMPNGDIKIRIRGISSINKSSDPLVLIDGVGGNINMVNPDDIQSIEILKDASSTAVYGSRGANGVILITTKRGQEGRPQVSFDSQVGVGTATNRYDMINPYEFAQIQRELRPETITDSEVLSFKDGTRGIDWWDQMTRPSLTQNYKLGIMGGIKATKYLISANVVDQTATMVETYFKKQSVRANLDTKIFDWLSVNTDIVAGMNKMHNGGVSTLVWSLLCYSPAMDMLDPVTGIYNKDNINMTVTDNPYATKTLNQNDSYSNSFRGMTDLKFSILDGLTLSVLGAANYSQSLGFSFSDAKVAPGATYGSSNSSYYGLTWQNTNNLTYDKTFGDHHITATAVTELIKSEGKSLSGSASNLQNGDIVGYWNLSNGATRNATNGYSGSSLASYFGRLFYSYQGRYMLTATYRADGSSKFQGDNKWGFFPSGAVAWNIAKESFMGNQNLFQQLKLRASTGITGNQAIANYATLGMLGSNTYAYNQANGATGYWGRTMATPGLKWERTHQWDVGVDASLLNERLNLTIDWYLKNTTDLLFQKQIPAYNGSGTFWINAGHIRNQGFEFLIDAFPVRKDGGFVWETIFTATTQKSKVIDLAGLEFLNGYEAYWGSFAPSTRLEPGKAIGSFWLKDYTGINAEGLYEYNQYDEDTGKIIGKTTDPQNKDKIMTGNANPALTYGWNNMFNFGNWEVNLILQGVLGVDRLNMMRSAMVSSSIPVIWDGWYKNWDYLKNHGGNIADAVYQSKTNPDRKRDFGDSKMYLEDASYLRVKNLSVAYRLPKSKVKFADVRLSLSAQNLFTFTKYSGLDPETLNIYNGGGFDTNDIIDFNNGLDMGAFPLPRTWTVGVRFDF